ncbi:hypothetical protein [Kitasatospora acidiphila]|uniref:hypothetical protein n=1 Tax=Kitasatospora acidiphila TaxID=2567942 RepID=UPI003C711B43
MVTRSASSTSPKTPTSTDSCAVRGARPPPIPAHSGAGNARRSNFPDAVNGNASNTTKTDGTIYPGNNPAT